MIFWIPKKTELEVNLHVSNFKDLPKKSNYTEINLKMIVLPDFVHVLSVSVYISGQDQTELLCGGGNFEDFS